VAESDPSTRSELPAAGSTEGPLKMASAASIQVIPVGRPNGPGGVCVAGKKMLVALRRRPPLDRFLSYHTSCAELSEAAQGFRQWNLRAPLVSSFLEIKYNTEILATLWISHLRCGISHGPQGAHLLWSRILTPTTAKPTVLRSYA